MDKSILPHLDDLSIFQLRVLGRQVGVALPTTLKKQELIDKIKAIMTGVAMPHVKKTNKGRPAKSINNVELVRSLETVENVFGNLESYYNVSLPDLACYESIKPNMVTNKDEFVLSGFVEVTEEGFGYFMPVPQKMSEPIYVKISIVVKFKLKSGDHIEAKILKDTSSNISIVADILKINGDMSNEEVDYYEFTSHLNQKRLEPIFELKDNKVMNFLSQVAPVYLGDRAIVSIDDKQSLTPSMFDLLANLDASENVTDIVFIAQELSDEFLDAIGCFKKVINVISRFGDAKEYQRKLFEMGFMHANRLASIRNRNVVLIVQNLSDALNLFSGENKERVNAFCKKYFISAKETQNSSLTCIYSFVGDLDLQNEYESNENVFIKFLPRKYLTKTKFKVNMMESFRLELTSINQKLQIAQEKIQSFLEKADYFEKHLELEKIADESVSVDDFLSKI